MPYKSRLIKIEKTRHDRRVKLTDEDKERIRSLHEEGNSIRALARAYKVSRRSIQYILFPERLELNKKHREARGGWRQYYDQKKHREYMKSHRKYKHQLYVDRKIGEAENGSN